MGMMTSAQYEESLRRLKLVVYQFGRRVQNVVDDPMIRPSLQAGIARAEIRSGSTRGNTPAPLHTRLLKAVRPALACR